MLFHRWISRPWNLNHLRTCRASCAEIRFTDDGDSTDDVKKNYLHWFHKNHFNVAKYNTSPMDPIGKQKAWIMDQNCRRFILLFEQTHHCGWIYFPKNKITIILWQISRPRWMCLKFYISFSISNCEFPHVWYCGWKNSCTGKYLQISHYLQGFIHPRWLGMGFLNQQQ